MTTLEATVQFLLRIWDLELRTWTQACQLFCFCQIYFCIFSFHAGAHGPLEHWAVKQMSNVRKKVRSGQKVSTSNSQSSYINPLYGNI